jgi:hypothetical protein
MLTRAAQRTGRLPWQRLVTARLEGSKREFSASWARPSHHLSTATLYTRHPHPALSLLTNLSDLSEVTLVYRPPTRNPTSRRPFTRHYRLSLRLLRPKSLVRPGLG